MLSLAEDLQSSKKNLLDFAAVTKRVLEYLPNVTSSKTEVKNYVIISSNIAGATKFARPIKSALFIFDSADFEKSFNAFMKLLKNVKKTKRPKRADQHSLISKVVYTIQQAIGAGLDLLSNPNSARKHVGNRFEELIRLIINQLEVANKKIVFKIPYPSDDGEKLYSCETDIIFSPYSEVKSESKHIDGKEVVVSLKTSSKDRMGKIFLDKMLMKKFAKKEVKVVGVFLNDVQRKGSDNISYTFVSGLFMVYTKFLAELEGVYFVDPPPKTREAPFKSYIFPFSKFVLEDIWKLLSPS